MQSSLIADQSLAERTVASSLQTPHVVTITDEVLRSHRPEPTESRGVDLPFTVRLVRTEAHLLKAIQIRAQAFMKHAPKFAAQLLEPEPADRAPGNVVLLAESKSTGAPEGSVRLETNFSFRTEFESIIELPDFLKGKTIAQASRLGVRPGAGGPLVRMALVKAAYRYCLATQIDYVLIAARTPVDRTFVSLGFKEVFPEPTVLSFPSQGNKFLRLFAVDIVAGERRWRRLKHPLYKFMVEDYHPDIEIFNSVRGMWSKPRSRAMREPALPLVQPAFDFPVV